MILEYESPICYYEYMGIGKRSDGSFYIRCDWDDCGYKIDLKAKDFYAAKEEAKALDTE